MTNHPATMYAYHVWANQVILEKIRELPSDVLSLEVNSSFPTLAHALSHIYAVDKMWYLVVTGTGMREAFEECRPLNTSILDTVEQYMDLYAELSGLFQQWLRDQTDLEQTLLLDNPFAGVRQTRLSEILLHLVNHGTYHRGNISTMLRQLGYATAMNDYAFFWYQESVEAI
ncbi:DinB family protein [Paenibacillus mesotrionivorans]|uniref:DinB family protein n=1 Tax=Paenibacillus mesotrionivorans TaxID=3160968 RepID=A0ACC7NX21_9BACL